MPAVKIEVMTGSFFRDKNALSLHSFITEEAPASAQSTQ